MKCEIDCETDDEELMEIINYLQSKEILKIFRKKENNIIFNNYLSNELFTANETKKVEYIQKFKEHEEELKKISIENKKFNINIEELLIKTQEVR